MNFRRRAASYWLQCKDPAWLCKYHPVRLGLRLGYTSWEMVCQWGVYTLVLCYRIGLVQYICCTEVPAASPPLSPEQHHNARSQDTRHIRLSNEAVFRRISTEKRLLNKAVSHPAPMRNISRKCYYEHSGKNPGSIRLHLAFRTGDCGSAGHQARQGETAFTDGDANEIHAPV